MDQTHMKIEPGEVAVTGSGEERDPYVIEIDPNRRTRDLTQWVQMPQDVPPAVIGMLRATLPDFWRAYLEAGGDPQDAEAFWQFMTSQQEATR